MFDLSNSHFKEQCDKKISLFEDLIKDKVITIEDIIHFFELTFKSSKPIGLESNFSSINFIENLEYRHYYRDYFIRNLSFAIPSKDAISQIKEFVNNDTIIEVGCGLGLWAALLLQEGINIIATEKHRSNNFYVVNRTPYTPLRFFSNLDALNKYTDCNVLQLIWPPYENSMAFESLSTFKGNKFIYIGENYGGCCADSDFFNLLDEEWDIVNCVNISNWSGIHDRLFFYKRK